MTTESVDSPNSLSNSNGAPSSKKTAREYSESIAQLRVAEYAADMASTQRVVDMNETAIRQGYRRERAVLNREAEWEDEVMPEEAPTDIRVDSPNVTHNYPPAPIAPKASKLLPYALAGAGMLASGGIGAAIVSYMTPKSPPKPPVESVDTDTQYELKLVD